MSERLYEPRLLGVLVTYRRPRDLEQTLGVLAGQDRPLDRLVVVDNDPTPEAEALVRAMTGGSTIVEYLPMVENVGFPGGLAAGMSSLLPGCDDRDWIAVLDDDDPPDAPDVFGDLLRFAALAVERDPTTAAVGLRGARFDRRRGLLTRVPTRDIDTAVPVDCIAGNAIPLYRAGALREVGPFMGPLFFSHEELELGLRLQRAGRALYGHGARWKARRASNARPDSFPEQRWRLLTPNWRSYYSLRNTIYILRTNGCTGAALRISLTRGILKPLMHLALAPRAAARALSLNVRAVADAWRGRLGRRVEPRAEVPRPKRIIVAPSHRP